MKFSELTVGQSAAHTKAITSADVNDFARISGDNNPLHVDDAAAAKSMFGQRIVHGILVTGLISAVLGTKLPGFGAIYASQELSFKAPVFLNAEVTATAVVTELSPNLKRGVGGRATLTTVVTDSAGKILVEGKAMLVLQE
jgi:3-hydroxybutyryl-CoA dehydratase